MVADEVVVVVVVRTDTGPYILFWPERIVDAYSAGQSNTAGGLALSNLSSNRPD